MLVILNLAILYTVAVVTDDLGDPNSRYLWYHPSTVAMRTKVTLIAYIYIIILQLLLCELR